MSKRDIREITCIVITELRKRKKLSQEELSGLAGLSRSHLAQIETLERLPTLATIDKICNALDVSISQFFRIVEQERKEK